MKKSNFDLKDNKPNIEINKPDEQDNWQHQGVSLWFYFVFMLLSLYLWQGFKQHQQQEIPYSEFLQKMHKGEIEEAVVTDKIISGKLSSPATDADELKVIAQRTPGFVGADLANIANEAAILAVREHHTSISMQDFEAAIDRVIAGPEKKHRALNLVEKKRVAYHESGHTLVAESVPTAEPVHKVSIIPRGIAALGYTLQLPTQEKFLSTEKELKDQIAILMGGRVAEELVYKDVSSGASNDLERATEIAHGMVTQLGMSKKLGPITFGKRQQLIYLGVQGAEEKNYSEETSRLIDSEVKILIEEGYQTATKILTEKSKLLDKLAALLEQKEVLTGEEVIAVINQNN